MRIKKIAAVLILLAAAGSLVYYFGYYRPEHQAGELKLSGHVEVTEVDLSFRQPGHVALLRVEEGDAVKNGQDLAALEDVLLKARRDQAAYKVEELKAARDSLSLSIDIRKQAAEADVERAEAAVSAAEARYEALKTGSRAEEIREAAAAMNASRTEWDNRKRDYERMKNLYARKIIPQSQYEDAGTALNTAKSAYLAALERYRLVKAGPRNEQVSEGEANLSGSSAALSGARAAGREVEKLEADLKILQARTEQARAQLVMAEDDLKEARILSPFDGFITVKSVEEGEFVQAGAPVLTVARLDRVRVRSYVPENRLGTIKLGMKAEIKTDSFPEKTYQGEITFISPKSEFTPKNVQTQEERVKLVYRIKISLDNPEYELKAGMPVDVYIR